MGSVTETTREVVDYLNAKGAKTGVVVVHLYRPFSAKYLLKVVPKSVKRITVLDRTKEPGANGEPLYLDIKEVFYGQTECPHDHWRPLWSQFKRYHSGSDHYGI